MLLSDFYVCANADVACLGLSKSSGDHALDGWLTEGRGGAVADGLMQVLVEGLTDLRDEEVGSAGGSEGGGERA